MEAPRVDFFCTRLGKVYDESTAASSRAPLRFEREKWMSEIETKDKLSLCLQDMSFRRLLLEKDCIIGLEKCCSLETTPM